MQRQFSSQDTSKAGFIDQALRGSRLQRVGHLALKAVVSTAIPPHQHAKTQCSAQACVSEEEMWLLCH